MLSVAAVTEDVPVNLDPHVRSPPLILSEAVDVELGNSSCRQDTVTHGGPAESRCVWLSAPGRGGD